MLELLLMQILIKASSKQLRAFQWSQVQLRCSKGRAGGICNIDLKLELLLSKDVLTFVAGTTNKP